jgi:hypothetical protein
MIYGLNGTANDLRLAEHLEEDPMMKTVMLAAVVVLSFGVGSAHAGDGEDGGTIADTFFTTLPGVIATAPGQRTNGVAANPHNAPTTAYRTDRAVNLPQLR